MGFTPKIAAKEHNFWKKWIELFYTLSCHKCLLIFSLYFMHGVFTNQKKDPKLGETFSCPYYLVDDAVFMLYPDIRCFSVTACDAWHAHQ